MEPHIARLPVLASFFFNDTATTEIYTLSLHDALPICRGQRQHVHGELERLEALLVPHAEAMLFVDDENPEIITPHLPPPHPIVARLLLHKKHLEPPRHQLGILRAAKPRAVDIVSSTHR